MAFPELFTPISVTAGILTNIATDILEFHAQSLEGTFVGKILKGLGLIEPNIYDRLHDVLWKALELYFYIYPERNVGAIDNFFLDADVSREIGNYILERHPIDEARIQLAFERHLGKDDSNTQQLQTQDLDAEQIVKEFIDCYRRVLREQLSLPQMVVLSEMMDLKETIVAEMRASEQQLRHYIAESLADSLSPQRLYAAYQEGQQQLAIALSSEINPPTPTALTGTDPTLQAIQARLQPTPDLFSTGLCQGRVLSPKPNQYFVSHSFPPDLLADWRQALVAGLAPVGDECTPLQPYFSGDSLLGGFRLCGLCEQLYTSRFSLFLLPPSQDRNVYLELGVAIALGAPFFLIQHYDAEIPAILQGLSRYVKGGLFRTMRRELAGHIEEYDFGVVRFIKNLPPPGSQPRYLIAAGDSIEDEDFGGSIEETLRSRYPQLEQLSLNQPPQENANSGWMLEQLVAAIQAARFAIYRVDETGSPATFLALGISIGLNRPFLMLHRANREVPLDLRGLGMYQFPNFVSLQQDLIPRHQDFFDRWTQ